MWKDKNGKLISNGCKVRYKNRISDVQLMEGDLYIIADKVYRIDQLPWEFKKDDKSFISTCFEVVE